MHNSMIVGVTQVVDDEFPRPTTTAEGLQRLKAAFVTDGSGSVTAGNASGDATNYGFTH